MGATKILIIDDSASMCFFMTNVLQRVGYQVSVALDGHNGLMKLTAQPHHCVILDIVLPDSNGYAICRQIRAADPQHALPVILTSTKNTPLDRSYGLKMGADRYLAKPFTEEELVKTVWEVLPLQARMEMTPPPKPASGPDLSEIVPRRRKSLRFVVGNPLGSAASMDQLSQHVYAAIDGQKTAKDLCQETLLDEQELATILQKLFEQRRIDFFDRHGYLLASSPFHEQH